MAGLHTERAGTGSALVLLHGYLGGSSQWAAEAGLSAMERGDGRAHLANIGAPTLIIWRDRDRSHQWARIESLWRGIAGALLAVLPQCAHALHLENPRAFRGLLLDFLTGPLPAR